MTDLTATLRPETMARHLYSWLLIQWEKQEITYRVSWQIDQILCFCLAVTQSTWQEPQQEEETTTVNHKTPKMLSTIFKSYSAMGKKSVCTHVANSHVNLLEKRKGLHKKYVQPDRICLVNQHAHRFIVLEHQIWPPWHHVKTLHRLNATKWDESWGDTVIGKKGEKITKSGKAAGNTIHQGKSNKTN